MSKNPAFLFYVNDYLGGTMGMTFEEKGAYIELLCLQFNRGHMGGHMVGHTVGQLFDKIKDKFIQDENGLWYNKRLEEEKNKREAYVVTRKNNIKGKNQHSINGGHMGGHLTTHMDNDNDNINNIKHGDENLGFDLSAIKEEFENSEAWQEGLAMTYPGSKIKLEIKEFLTYVQNTGKSYPKLSDAKTHFVNRNLKKLAPKPADKHEVWNLPTE
jgi:uncharacterized protein YdaU (DUF1376 family)